MPDASAGAGHTRLVPPIPRALGALGLLPQGAAALLAALDPPLLRAAGVMLASGYAALILSFLGGMWWGLAAAAPASPRWTWLAAVAPSLWALACLVAGLAIGLPNVALVPLALAVLLTPLVDRRLAALGLAPHWWMRLRVPLSVGLALLTAIVAVLAWR